MSRQQRVNSNQRIRLGVVTSVRLLLRIKRQKNHQPQLTTKTYGPPCWPPQS